MVVASPATRRRGGDMRSEQMNYTYALWSLKSGRLYIGSTDDLRRRLLEHNSGRGGVFTRKNGPFKLVYYEAFLTGKDAQNQEAYYKTGSGREVLRSKIRFSLESLINAG